MENTTMATCANARKRRPSEIVATDTVAHSEVTPISPVAVSRSVRWSFVGIQLPSDELPYNSFDAHSLLAALWTPQELLLVCHAWLNEAAKVKGICTLDGDERFQPNLKKDADEHSDTTSHTAAADRYLRRLDRMCLDCDVATQNLEVEFAGTALPSKGNATVMAYCTYARVCVRLKYQLWLCRHRSILSL
ncbi:hypothetical protein Q7P35_005011 [Cladosporium inversicolor]